MPMARRGPRRRDPPVALGLVLAAVVAFALPALAGLVAHAVWTGFLWGWRL